MKNCKKIISALFLLIILVQVTGCGPIRGMINSTKNRACCVENGGKYNNGKCVDDNGKEIKNLNCEYDN